MKDKSKTKKQLIDELNQLRQFICELNNIPDHHHNTTTLKGSEDEFKQIRENQEKFTKSFLKNSIPIGLSKLRDGRFVEVSEAFLQLMGLKRDEVIGHTSTGIGFITEEQRSIFFNELHKKGRVENLEMQVGTKGGELRYGAFNAAMITINNEMHLLTVMMDITERKQAEEALRASEAQVRAIFENAPLGIVYYNQNGVIINCNANFIKLIGSSREAIIGLNVLKLRDEAVVKALRTVLNGKISSFEGEYRSFTANKVTHARMICVPTFLKNGEINGGIAFAEDITDRKKVEEVLRESEERFASFMFNLPAVAFIKDHNGHNVFFNQFLKDMMGFHDCEGKTNSDLLSEQLAKRVTDDDRRAMEQGTLKIEETMADCHGALHIFETIKFPIHFEGKPDMLGGIAIDITERKRAEAFLQESETKFRSLVENSLEGILIIDLQGMILFANNTAARIIEVSDYASLVGRNVMEFVEPESLEDVARDFMNIAQGRDAYLAQYFIQTTQGKKICVESIGKIINYEGNPADLISIRDITVRKEMEERIKRLEKMETLGRVAGGVAHDLNNLLGIMVGYSELLLNEADVQPPLKKDLKTIMDSGQKAASVVQDLLTMARKGVAVRKTLNLNQIISDYLDSAVQSKLSMVHHGIHLRTALEPGLLNISGSEDHLGKVVMNLVMNAMEAISCDGAVTIRTENRYLYSSVQGYEEIRAGEYAVLSIADTGKGISPQDLPHIFEPFYTTKQMRRSGSGLGLSVVWGAVKDHDGYIDVQSEKSKGTIFTLYLPITRVDLSNARVA